MNMKIYAKMQLFGGGNKRTGVDMKKKSLVGWTYIDWKKVFYKCHNHPLDLPEIYATQIGYLEFDSTKLRSVKVKITIEEIE